MMLLFMFKAHEVVILYIYYVMCIIIFNCRCNASHEILTNEIAGKASPGSALNHVMCIKLICNKTLIALFRVQFVF